MKTINPFQLEQKKYDTIELTPDFKPTFGSIPKNVHMVIFGDSGNGKTELVMRFVKCLCLLEVNVDWISYEQGHGMDLQQACMRNRMIEVKDYFQISDPDSKDDNISYFEDLEDKVRKRGSCDVFVIDSIQYTRFTFDDYKKLKTLYKKKSFIWISHKDGKLPLGKVAKDVAYDGGITIMVKNFIAHVLKNRFGGYMAYIIWEERARLLEQKFFLDRDKAAKKTLFTEPENAENEAEEMGVDAHD